VVLLERRFTTIQFTTIQFSFCVAFVRAIHVNKRTFWDHRKEVVFLTAVGAKFE